MNLGIECFSVIQNKEKVLDNLESSRLSETAIHCYLK